MDTVAEELIIHWPNVKDIPAFDFWEYEWRKHGIIAAQHPQMNSAVKYFQQCISWRKQFNIIVALEMANIYPGKAYYVADVEAAVRKAFGHKPQISCTRTFSPQLLEVRLCFNQNLDLIDCILHSGCPNHERIKYPAP